MAHMNDERLGWVVFLLETLLLLCRDRYELIRFDAHRKQFFSTARYDFYILHITFCDREVTALQWMLVVSCHEIRIRLLYQNDPSVSAQLRNNRSQCIHQPVGTSKNHRNICPSGIQYNLRNLLQT